MHTHTHIDVLSTFQAKCLGLVYNNLSHYNPMAGPQTMTEALRERIEPF